MTNENLSALRFPKLRSVNRGNWVPLFLEPVIGSGERICIGVVASDGTNFEVAAVPNIAKLSACLGLGAESLNWAAELALRDVEKLTLRHGLTKLATQTLPVQGLSVGDERSGAGTDLRDIAKLALRQSSSLCAVMSELDTEGALTIGSVAAETPQPLGVAGVKAAVVRRQPDLREYFDRRFTPRQAARPINFGFVSSISAINFSTLSAASANGLTIQVDRAKARILDLESLREGLLSDGLPVRRSRLKYELHVLRPEVPKRSEAYSLLRAAEYSLESQADKFGVQWRPFATTNSMADWIVRSQKAA